jgi:hypothetical protein
MPAPTHLGFVGAEPVDTSKPMPYSSLSTTLVNAATDAAAQAAGVPIGGMYRNGSIVMVRVA